MSLNWKVLGYRRLPLENSTFFFRVRHGLPTYSPSYFIQLQASTHQNGAYLFYLAMFIKSLILILLAGNLLAASSESPNTTQKTTTITQYLSGKGPSDGVKWDFFCTKGRRSGTWEKITVPLNWEFEGFGGYNYGSGGKRFNEVGKYKHSFKVPTEWKGRAVQIVFDGVMTDCTVQINGKLAGPTHQGGFYQFKLDISKHLNYGADNLLEVDVRKVSADPTLEIAERRSDYWTFAGIYRPVYLEALPAEHIARVAIDAQANGAFTAQVFSKHPDKADRITGQIETLDGKAIGKKMEFLLGKGTQTLSTRISNPRTWSAETPILHRIRLRLWSGDRLIHEVSQRFGFRTFEVRQGEGLFVNGTRVLLKGVNRHCFRPETGRALDDSDSLEDVQLIQAMNMNSVRCSHYPPDAHFLELCDEMGLYVIDELCTWGKPAMGTDIARKLVKELVVHDVNHPSILFWANGNEGGWNTEVDGDFNLYDPQKRPVLHPWASFSGVQTDHYESYASVQKYLKGPEIYMPTEFLHGLYDGGHGAGLDDYWNIMSQSKFSGGGFLWVLADEGAARADQNGKIDTWGNCAPDGIVGPHHEKEGSFATIREVWSPIGFPMEKISENFDGVIPVENRYDFLSLDDMNFTWKLLKFTDAHQESVLGKGSLTVEGVKARLDGQLKLTLPKNWRDAHTLQITALNSAGRDIFTKSWPILKRKDVQTNLLSKNSDAHAQLLDAQAITVKSGDSVFSFSKETGQLVKVTTSGQASPLANGPRLLARPVGGSIDIKSATASTHQKGRDPKYALDSKPDTYWAAEGDGVWLQLDFGTEQSVSELHIDWHKAGRKNKFEIQLSSNGSDWKRVFSGRSNGKASEDYFIPTAPARYLRLVGHGNEENRWTSVAGISLGGETIAPARPTVTASQQGASVIIASSFKDSDASFKWTVHPGGALQLDYQFPVKSGRYYYAGIGFDLPASQVKSKQWLGGGPYRVWQNRMKGPEFGLWKNDYNNGIPGEDWNLPAFKGCFKDVFWMQFNLLKDQSLTVAPTNPDSIVGVLRPPLGKIPKRSVWSYPGSGGLFFFQVISTVGTKTQPASTLGPQSQPGKLTGPVKGQVMFKF